MDEELYLPVLTSISDALNAQGSALGRIANALERQVPTFVFMTDNGGLVPLPEHLRDDAKGIPTTPLAGCIELLSKSVAQADRSDPGIRAIAATLSNLEQQLVLMQRGPVEPPDLSTGIPVQGAPKPEIDQAGFPVEQEPTPVEREPTGAGFPMD